MSYGLREKRTVYQFRYILIVGFLRNKTFRVPSATSNKRYEYSTGYRVPPSTSESPRDVQRTWLLPLGELPVWGANNAQSKRSGQQRLKAMPRPLQPLRASRSAADLLETEPAESPSGLPEADTHLSQEN